MFNAYSSRGVSRMRYTLLCLPLIVAYIVLALVSGADARALPDPSDASALARRGNQVTLPPANNFVVGSIIGQPPQTRTYNFVVEQLQGAPDGFSKPMIVVNGSLSLLYRESFWLTMRYIRSISWPDY